MADSNTESGTQEVPPANNPPANPTGMSYETLRQRLLDEHSRQERRAERLVRGSKQAK